MSGATVAAIDVAGEPAAWRALGFTVDSDGHCAIGATLLRIRPHDTPRLAGWALRDAQGEGPVDGVPTQRVTWTSEGMAHENGATSVDHVVVLTPDTARTFAALEAAGMTLRHERDTGSGERPLRQGFFRHGECIVEVVGPPQPEAGDDRPARLWGLTLVVEDLDATAEFLGERLGEVKDAVQPGRRIATLRAEAGLGVPLALMTP